MVTTRRFKDKDEYIAAIAEYKKYNSGACSMESDNLENYEIGTCLFDPNNLDNAVNFVHKFKRGKPQNVIFDDLNEWLKAIEEVKQKYNKPLMSSDNARELTVGYLSVDAKTIYKITLYGLKMAACSVDFNSPESRKAFGEALLA